MTFGKCAWDGCTRHAEKPATNACRAHHTTIRPSLREVPGAARERPRGGRATLSTLRRESRGLSVSAPGCGLAPRLLTLMGMSPEPEYEPDFHEDTAADTAVHRFTVQRGMAIALVIETRDWYSGLLQAAMARVRIEGQN